MANPHTLHVRVNAPIGALQLNANFSTHAPWTVLFGPSGSGKSSLLRLITGLWTPQDAAVTLDAKPLTATPTHQRHIALVAQQAALFTHKTVQENIAFGYQDKGSDHANRIAELIQAFGLTAHANSRPATLSGGERQRVAIARSLGSAPHYLLLDEVFTGMHTAQRHALIATLRTYSQRFDMPILSVTHDVAEALQADEVLKIADGRITAQGPAQTVLAEERSALLQQLADRITPLSQSESESIDR